MKGETYFKFEGIFFYDRFIDYFSLSIPVKQRKIRPD